MEPPLGMTGGEIRVQRSGGDPWIVVLRGELDLTTADALDERLRQVHTHGTQVVLDLSEASFIDTTVIKRVFTELTHAHANAGSALAVVAPTGSQPRRLLELVRAPKVVQIVEHREEAVAMVSRQGDQNEG